MECISQYPAWLPETEYPAWEEFVAFVKRSLSKPTTVQSDILSVRRVANRGSLFGIVLTNIDKYAHIHILRDILFLAHRLNIERGGMLLHSAVVVRGHKGFLFLGNSNAGKTTVTQLSSMLGYESLGDELNFVLPHTEGKYLLAMAPSLMLTQITYSSSRPVLSGIFDLAQDVADFIIPLSPTKVAQRLFQSAGQTPQSVSLSEQEIRMVFQTCCNIARNIPGYELHFRKSPEFWKLIDEQFPD